MSGLRAWWAARSPAAGAAVMATGIVSTALLLIGAETVSRVALVLAGVFWVALGAGFVRRLVVDRDRWAAEARSPAALTAVAATAVLGSRLSASGRQATAAALLALAALLWAVLLPVVVRHWHRRMPGSVFLSCVATEGLSVPAAALAAAERTAWLARAALVLFWLGLVIYAFALPRFDVRQVLEGAGDHWVAGGALALSTLAGAGLLAAGNGGLYLWNDDDRATLRITTAVLLAVSLAVYLALLVAEAVRPRPGYDQRRWATVFPMGMTAAATLSVASAMDVPWLRGPGRVLVWMAVAAWLWVAAAMVADAVRATRAGTAAPH
ncbi:tellurite resistance/C4-dicarboxylate transporter family protein [Streptomyces sp. NPDC001056]